MRRSRIRDKRFCRVCDSDKTYNRTAKNKPIYPQWHRDGLGGWICKRCYNRLITFPLDRQRYPDRVKEWNRFTAMHRINYKGRLTIVNRFPRVGICSECGREGLTHMHHYGRYIAANPLANTMELCLSCHAKKGQRDWHGRFSSHL